MAKVKITGHASGSGVITVTAPNTSTDRTITLPDSTDTLIGTATTDALTTRINGASGRKNIIINGSMRVAQRGTSFTDPASGAFTLDRWKAGVHTSTAAANYTQEADAPTAAQAGTNFVNCLKHTCTTTDTSTAATIRYYTKYQLEGTEIAHAGFGQAGVRYMTLSFWHKHTKTGVNSFGVVNTNSDRQYVAEYTQTTSDTWEKATHTFPVDTTGTWATDTGKAINLYFATHIGSNYQGTANTWGTGQAYGTANQVNNFDSTSNSMRFTGMQLELGSTATDFEYRSYGEELALCQRYYSRSTTLSGLTGAAVFHAYSTTESWGGLQFPVTMRTTPTITVYNNAGTSGGIHRIGGPDLTGVTVGQISATGFAQVYKNGALLADDIYACTYTASAEL